MSSAIRPGSFLDRAFHSRQERSVPPVDTTLYSSPVGLKALFKSQQSLGADGDNVWLYRSVLSIAMEVGSTTSSSAVSRRRASTSTILDDE